MAAHESKMVRPCVWDNSSLVIGICKTLTRRYGITLCHPVLALTTHVGRRVRTTMRSDGGRPGPRQRPGDRRLRSPRPRVGCDLQHERLSRPVRGVDCRRAAVHILRLASGGESTAPPTERVSREKECDNKSHPMVGVRGFKPTSLTTCTASWSELTTPSTPGSFARSRGDGVGEGTLDRRQLHRGRPGHETEGDGVTFLVSG
jgi:hypothetical protein